MNETQDFQQAVLNAVNPAGVFQPMAVFDPDGDCIEFLASDESYYAERFDSLVTVYWGRESGQIVGSLIKGVTTFIKNVLNRAPGLRIEIHDGKIKLVHFFTAYLWVLADAPQGTEEVRIYSKLRGAAERTGVEVNFNDLVATP